MSFFKKPTTGRFADDELDTAVRTEQPLVTEEEYDDFKTQPPSQPSGGFSGVNLGGGSLELKVVKPTVLDDLPTIANHLLNHCTVVLNLEATSKEVSRRMIDFFMGLVYAIDGQLKKVAAATYIVTPCNVDITDGNHAAPAASPAPRAADDGDDFIPDIEG